MAELLVMNVSARSQNPHKDRTGCPKLGDVIVVMPDRWNWGREELRTQQQGGGIFRIVKVPGLRPAEFRQRFVERFGHHPDGPARKDGILLRHRRKYLALQDDDATMTFEQLCQRVGDRIDERQ